jgi:hypothetical protein
MSRFRGNNRQRTLRQFLERRNFSLNAYGGGGVDLYPRPIRDFNFAERVLYGRVNKVHDPITLRKTYLKSLADAPPEGPVLEALDFVADAFSAMATKWESLRLIGKISDTDEMLSTLKPQRAYADPQEHYAHYQESLRNTFLNSYLTPERNKSIVNFESFLKVFRQYVVEISATVPVTYIGFVPSTFAGPLISGLCIDVAQLDASDDAVKERFINSPNFGYYKLYARTYGFSIDKQVPWRLVADIASPQMLNFATSYGPNTEEEVLNNYYRRVGGRDLYYLQQMAIGFYNFLVDAEPTMRVSSDLFSACRHGARYITREPIDVSTALALFPFNYWVDMYIDVRYNEQRKPVSEAVLREVKSNAARLEDFQNAEFLILNYINNTIRTFDNFRGSYASRARDIQALSDNTTTSTY